MKLRATLARPGRADIDLSVVYGSTTTVGDVAEYLFLADPERGAGSTPPRGLTLGVAGSRHSTLDPERLLAESGVRSGQTLTLTRAGERFVDSERRAAAVLKVLEGPDRGQEFSLVSGSNVVGRGRGCEVRLTDLMVSRQHVRINVTDHVELIDLGSANGVLINDKPAEREVVQPSDRITVGDTAFSIRMVQSAAVQGRVEATAVAFIRSPRLVKPYPGVTFAAPEIPERPQSQRFPTLAMIAPIILAGVMYWFTQQPLTLLFMALSPLMMLGSYLDQLFTGKAAFKRSLKLWRADLSSLVADVTRAKEEEARCRLVEHPSAAECVAAVSDLSNVLWTRRVDAPGFGEFRLGLGAQRSRNEIEMPDAKRAPRDVYAELVAAVTPLLTVEDVPVVASPAAEGGLGVAGPRSASAAAARGLVVQAATLHSPEELVIAAVASARTSQDWDWLKWLPHCHSNASPLAAHLASTTSGASAVLGRIEELIEARLAARSTEATALPAVLLLVESDAPAEFGRLVSIAESGWRCGVFVLWVASDLSQLPAACRVYLELRTMTDAMVGYLKSGDAVTPVQVEVVSLDMARAWATAMAPITDLAARSDDTSDVPRSVNLLGVPGFDAAVSAGSILERWRANRSIVVGPLAPERPSGKAGSLRAVIGLSATGPHSLDLRTDGPHALVGGTTGSGKSELLQTWILAMAASHTPQRLNFLLVDYKGGSAFADCNNLPHTVGLVTDLNKNGVRRALTSLAAELHFRERLITEQHRCKDLPTMEKSFPAVAPPSLVIVVDEFAALVQEVPEFIDGVINVAQRGRSLGLHMILATQQPSGVIKGALRANTNLRLALRVADVDDSNDVLGSPQAAFFDQETPGRAVSKTGPGRLVPFQTGYVGGHTGTEPVRADVKVHELEFGEGRPWERPADESEASRDRGPADITRIVAAITDASAGAQLPEPRKPWLPELKAHYDLAREIPTRRMDTELVYGMLDDPDRQRQVPVAFRPDVEGNLIVYGAGGAGKTTLLRTLAVAAGFTIRGGPCHVYGLDFASRGLDMLEVLPHVGSIINGADDERVQRLLKWLRALIAERSERYRQVNAGTITEYRQMAAKAYEPRVLVLIDGIAAFRAAHETVDRYRYLDLLDEVAAQGRPVGVHFVLASDQRGGLSTSLASTIQRRIVMRMADPEEYGFLGVPAGILSPDSQPGRCIVDDQEVQVAVLGTAADAQSQAAALEAFGASMQKSGARPAEPIRRLPERVPLGSLAQRPGQLRLGMEAEGFGVATIEPIGPFLVAGPTGSGRTTAMLTILAELRRLGLPIHILADRRSPVTESVGAASLIVGADRIMDETDRLAEGLAASAVPQAVLIEGLGELAGTEADYGLGNLIRRALAGNHFVVAEGEINSLQQAYDLMKRFKAGRRGLMLQPDDGMAHLLQANLPRSQATDFPVGRGFLVERGMWTLIQTATASQADG